jgi:tetratricopeptide (TPR) repeat protein
MRALRNLIVLLIVIVVIGFFIPLDLRNGYFFYWYGRITELTGNDTGRAAALYKQASGAMEANATFARAYARALNDIANGFDRGSTNAEKYYNDALDFCDRWIEEYEASDDIWMLYVEKSRAEWGLGRKNAARVSIDKAVDIMPTDYVALVYQGIIWRDFSPNDKDAIAASVRVFEQAISVRNETRASWAHYELAVAYKMINDEVRALNEIQQCLAQWPDRKLRQNAERLKHEVESSGRTNR